MKWLHIIESSQFIQLSIKHNFFSLKQMTWVKQLRHFKSQFINFKKLWVARGFYGETLLLRLSLKNQAK